MTSSEESDHLNRDKARWQEQTLGPAISRLPEHKPVFKNTSGIELQGVYTPADLGDFDYQRDLGFPGEFPYTRGVHA